MSEMPPEPEGTDEDRIDRVEGKVDRLTQLVERLIPSHGQAERREARRLDRPSSIEEQARAAARQVMDEERDRQARESETAAARAHREKTDSALARLEQPPSEERAPWKRFISGV